MQYVILIMAEMMILETIFFLLHNYRKVKRADRMIKQQIDNLKIERIAPVHYDIEKSIQNMYWNGTYSKRKYNEMMNLLEDKYTNVLNNYYNQVHEDMERSWELMKQHYDIVE